MDHAVEVWMLSCFYAFYSVSGKTSDQVTNLGFYRALFDCFVAIHFGAKSQCHCFLATQWYLHHRLCVGQLVCFGSIVHKIHVEAQLSRSYWGETRNASLAFVSIAWLKVICTFLWSCFLYSTWNLLLIQVWKELCAHLSCFEAIQ